jgi:hypothetical protein
MEHRTGRANFRPTCCRTLLDERTRASGQLPDLILQSMRSHDQYNTTIYGLDDRYRGVRASATCCSPTKPTSSAWASSQGRRSTSCRCGRWHVRRVQASPCWRFDIPAGQAAAYYPEVNPLVPLESIGDGSHTPTSKFIAIKLERARDAATGRI